MSNKGSAMNTTWVRGLVLEQKVQNVVPVKKVSVQKPSYTDEELRQIQEDEEYDRRWENDQWDMIEILEKRYEREEKIKDLEKLRQQLTFNVDESGEIHLVKRDINNNDIHITRVSKARDVVWSDP